MRWGGKGNPLGTVLKSEIWSFYQNDTNKMLKFVTKNELHKILRDFEIQTDPLTSARRPDRVKIDEKENLLYNGLYRSSEPQSENQRKLKERQLFAARHRTKRKVPENGGDGDTNCISIAKNQLEY